MRRVWLVVSCSVVLAAPAWAQSNVEVNAGIQLDFPAFTNPAGLRALSRMEVSFEARKIGFDIPVI